MNNFDTYSMHVYAELTNILLKFFAIELIDMETEIVRKIGSTSISYDIRNGFNKIRHSATNALYTHKNMFDKGPNDMIDTFNKIVDVLNEGGKT